MYDLETIHRLNDAAASHEAIASDLASMRSEHLALQGEVDWLRQRVSARDRLLDELDGMLVTGAMPALIRARLEAGRQELARQGESPNG